MENILKNFRMLNIPVKDNPLLTLNVRRSQLHLLITFVYMIKYIINVILIIKQIDISAYMFLFFLVVYI